VARLFNGTSDAASVALDLSTSPIITVSFRMYWNAFASDDDLAAEYTVDYNGRNGFLIDPNSGAVFVAGMSSPGGFWVDQFARPSAAAWHLYTFVFDRTTPANKVWVDGISQSLTVTSHSTFGGGNFDNATLFLMSRNAASLFGAGRMAEIAIWDVELSAGNLTLLHDGALPSSVDSGNLLSYWPVCGLASPEPAVVGASLTVTGATFADHPVVNPSCMPATGFRF
jgi:hypothetical protein